MFGFALVNAARKPSSSPEKMILEFNQLISANDIKVFSESIDAFIITLYLSGEVEQYDISGVGRVVLQKKKRELRIEAGMNQDEWIHLNEREMRLALSEILKEALEAGLKKLNRNKEFMPNSVTLNSIDSAIHTFKNH